MSKRGVMLLALALATSTAGSAEQQSLQMTAGSIRTSDQMTFHLERGVKVTFPRDQQVKVSAASPGRFTLPGGQQPSRLDAPSGLHLTFKDGELTSDGATTVRMLDGVVEVESESMRLVSTKPL